jgi:hypothetical protein
MAKEELQTEESIKDKMEKAFKKGSKRHRVAVQKKKERDGKAVNYSTMAQSYEPDGEADLVEEPERTTAYKAMQKKLYPRGSTIDAKTGKDNATSGQIGGFRKQINRGRKRKVMAEFEPELEMVEDTGSEQRAAIKDAILQRKEALKKKMKKRLNKEDWKPEIEHSKLGDAVKKKREKKRKEAESSLPPHLRLDTMKKAFAHTNEGYRVLVKGEDGKRGQFSYKDEKDAKKFASTFKKATVTKEENALEKRAKENEKARKWLKKDAKDSGYTDIALKASMSKGAGVSEERHPRDQKELDRAQAFIKKNPKFGKKVVKEEGAPTMSTGSTATAAGFSDQSDENGPTAGMSQPLGGLRGKPRGRGPKLKKQKYKCRTDEIGNKICTTEAHLMGDSKKVKIMSGVHDTRYWPHIVELDGTPGTDFVFYGRSPADVKLRLRKIYRPEQHKNMKVKRISPGEAIKYHWNKKLEAS